MGKQSAVDLDITNNSDGFDISGGNTRRKLTSTGADITMTGSGTNTYTFPASTDTLVGRTSTDTLTNKTLTTPTIGDFSNSLHDHTSSAEGMNLRQVATITSTFTTTNLTATDVTSLNVTIPVNTTWGFRFTLSNASTTSAGIKFAVTIPSGATWREGQIFGGTTAATTTRQDRITAASTLGNAFNTVNGDNVTYITGVVSNGGNSGTIQLQVAKVTSGTATVYAYSQVEAWLITTP